MKNNLEEKLLNDLKTHDFRKYSDDYFKRYFATDEKIGTSKAKRIITAKVINIYSTYKKRLLCRSFYIVEGYENKKFYRHIYEIKRQLAGMKKIITNRIYASAMGGIKIIAGDWYRYYFTYSVDVKNDEKLWEEHNVDNFILYTNSKYQVVEHNDYRVFLKKSIHKYCAFEYTDYSIEELFKYLKKYDDHPHQIEMLAKNGLNHLIRNTTGLRFSKPMPDFLGIEKKDMVYLKSLKLQINEFRKNIKWIKKHNIKDRDEYKLYKILYENNINVTKKLILYLNQQLQKINEDLYYAAGCCVHGYSFLNVIHLYVDYIKMIREMAIICNSENKYPADLKKSHDDLIKKIKVVRSKAKNKQILDNSRKYEKYIYFSNDYLIIPCRSTDELIEESRVLNHCVKDYVDKVAKNETEIFFIRKKTKPNIPYATLELKDRKINQCYCKGNSIPDDDIKNFVKRWANKYKLKLECWGENYVGHIQ